MYYRRSNRRSVALLPCLLLALPLVRSLPPAPAPSPDFPHLQQRHTLRAAICHRDDDVWSLLSRSGDGMTSATGTMSEEELARRVQHDVLVTGASFGGTNKMHPSEVDNKMHPSEVDGNYTGTPHPSNPILPESLMTLLLIVGARAAVVLLLLGPLLSIGRGEYLSMVKKLRDESQASNSPGRAEYRRASSHAVTQAVHREGREGEVEKESNPKGPAVDASMVQMASTIHHLHHRHSVGSSMSSVSMPSSASSCSSSSDSSPASSPRNTPEPPAPCFSEHDLLSAFAIMDHHPVSASDLLPFMVSIPRNSISRDNSRLEPQAEPSSKEMSS